jgi:DNA-binding MarR family transcriptional regulator
MARSPASIVVSMSAFGRARVALPGRDRRGRYSAPTLPAHRPLPFDPIAEAERNWSRRWDGEEVMAAATSITRAQQIVLNRVDEALRPWELTFARYEVLVLLTFSRTGALPMGKIGERLQVHPTSVTSTVDRLVGQNYVQRRPHPTDRRTVLAGITEEGRVAAQEATRAVVDAEFGLGALTVSDLRQLTKILRKLRLAEGDFSD